MGLCHEVGTVLASIDTPFTVNPHLYRDMGFDPAELVPIALVSSFPLVLLVHPGSSIADFAGFVAAAHARPLFYTSAGIGSGSGPSLYPAIRLYFSPATLRTVIFSV